MLHGVMAELPVTYRTCSKSYDQQYHGLSRLRCKPVRSVHGLNNCRRLEVRAAAGSQKRPFETGKHALNEARIA